MCLKCQGLEVVFLALLLLSPPLWLSRAQGGLGTLGFWDGHGAEATSGCPALARHQLHGQFPSATLCSAGSPHSSIGGVTLGKAATHQSCVPSHLQLQPSSHPMGSGFPGRGAAAHTWPGSPLLSCGCFERWQGERERLCKQPPMLPCGVTFSNSAQCLWHSAGDGTSSRTLWLSLARR